MHQLISYLLGLPKPIPLAHRYLLGYAACHLFQEDDDKSIGHLNLSTLPLFHVFHPKHYHSMETELHIGIRTAGTLPILERRLNIMSASAFDHTQWKPCGIALTKQKVHIAHDCAQNSGGHHVVRSV